MKRGVRRAPRVPGVDTPEGAREAAEAGQWWQAFNVRQGKNPVGAVLEAGEGSDPMLPGEPSLRLTRHLPGYGDALVGARAALLSLYGRVPFVRELQRGARNHGEDSLEFTNAVLMALASYGDFTHGPALRDAGRWHESRGTRLRFVRELAVRQANAGKKPFPNFGMPPMADLPAVSSTLVRLWVGAGFWLCSFEGIAAMLAGRVHPGRGAGPLTVTAANLERIASDLKLARYRPTHGAGWLVVNSEGGCAPDVALLDELQTAGTHGRV